jgi:LPPG:FO 2-phospho-L-lactate transferase
MPCFIGIERNMITVIAGGTGSVKLVRALARLVPDLNVICNVADNFWLMGLYVCPDIDTMIYGLSDNLDLKKGWGMKNESFSFFNHLKALGQEIWFQLGDKDLATHLLRTNMMNKGYSLSSITNWMRNRYGIQPRIIPVTDDHVETLIKTDKGEMHIQEFWVKNRGSLHVKGIRYRGLKRAKVNISALRAIKNSQMIVIAPGNPISSIWPIVSHRSIETHLSRYGGKVMAISPIIGSSPVSGPAAKYLKAFGIDCSILGIASLYHKFNPELVVSSQEELESIEEVNKMGINVSKTNILMRDQNEEHDLARFVLASLPKKHFEK